MTKVATWTSHTIIQSFFFYLLVQMMMHRMSCLSLFISFAYAKFTCNSCKSLWFSDEIVVPFEETFINSINCQPNMENTRCEYDDGFGMVSCRKSDGSSHMHCLKEIDLKCGKCTHYTSNAALILLPERDICKSQNDGKCSHSMNHEQILHECKSSDDLPCFEDAYTTNLTDHHCLTCKGIVTGGRDNILSWDETQFKLSSNDCQKKNGKCVFEDEFGFSNDCTLSNIDNVPCLNNVSSCAEICSLSTPDSQCYDFTGDISTCQQLLLKSATQEATDNTTLKVSLTVPGNVNYMDILNHASNNVLINDEVTQLHLTIPDVNIQDATSVLQSQPSDISYHCYTLTNGLFVVEASLNFDQTRNSMPFPIPFISHWTDNSYLLQQHLGYPVEYVSGNMHKDLFYQESKSMLTNETVDVTQPYYTINDHILPHVHCVSNDCTVDFDGIYGGQTKLYFVGSAYESIHVAEASNALNVVTNTSCSVNPPPSPSPYLPPPLPSHPPSPHPPPPQTPLILSDFQQETSIELVVSAPQNTDISTIINPSQLAILKYKMKYAITSNIQDSKFSEFVHKIDTISISTHTECKKDEVQTTVCGNTALKECQVSCTDNTDDIVRKNIVKHKNFNARLRHRRTQANMCITQNCMRNHRNLQSTQGIEYHIVSLVNTNDDSIPRTVLPSHSTMLKSDLRLDTFALSKTPIDVVDLSTFNDVGIQNVNLTIGDVSVVNPPSPPPFEIISDSWSSSTIALVVSLSILGTLCVCCIILCRLFKLQCNVTEDTDVPLQSKKTRIAKINVVETPNVVTKKEPKTEKVPCDTIKQPKILFETLGFTVVKKETEMMSILPNEQPKKPPSRRSARPQVQ